MTKLSAIIDAATGEEVSVSGLLRMVKVVAARLGTEQLNEWVNHELEGYPEETELPPYRGPFEAEVMGHFSGPFGSEVTIPLPSLALPEQLRKGWGFKVAFFQPVSELEGLARAKQNLQNRWGADSVAVVNHLVQKHEVELVPMHGLVEAYKVVSPQQVHAVLDAVRTRVLNLALDLEKVAPEAGEVNATPTDPIKVATVVNNNIFGDGNNVAVGSPGAVQGTSVVKPGDLSGLLSAAAAAGLPPEEVDLLKRAIKEDAADAGNKGTPEPGPRVRDYLGKLALGTGGVAGKIGIGAAGSTIATLVRSYFGLG